MNASGRRTRIRIAGLLTVAALLVPAVPALAASPVVEPITPQVVNGGYATTAGLGQHTAQFDVVWSDADAGDSHQVRITWGDGTPDEFHDAVTSPHTVSHTYPGPGEYLVTVRVTDSQLAFGQVYTKVHVADLSSGAVSKFYGSTLADAERFGQSVALGDGVAVVGEPRGGSNGRVHVFRSTDEGATWALEQTLLPITPHTGIDFGVSVAVDGATIVVGARADYRADGVRGGGVYVFDRDADGWSQSAVLHPSAEGADDFGFSVALEGDRLVVGDPGRSVGGELFVGNVSFFERGADGVWAETAVVGSPNAAAYDNFGRAVALAGEVVAVGAPGHLSSDTNPAGMAYAYRWPAGGSPTGPTSTGSGAEHPDQVGSTSFGSSVSIGDDGLVIVGAPGHHVTSSSRGAVFVLRMLVGAFEVLQGLTASDGQFGLGEAVDVDGSVIAAHALGTQGRDVVLYRQVSATSWARTHLLAPDRGTNNVASNAENARVAVRGDVILSGQDGDNDLTGWNSNPHGAALLYDVPRPVTGPVAVVLTRAADLSEAGFDPVSPEDPSGPGTTGDFFLDVEVFSGSFGINMHTRDEHSRDVAIAEPYSVVATEVSGSTATVVLSVLDADNGDGVSFDVADINPDPNETDLTIELDLETGSWSGDLNAPDACSRGDDPQRAVDACFAFSTRSPTADADGDTLFDSWELFGFDTTSTSGGIEDLPGWGADPGRMDLFVELDCLVDDGDGDGYSATDPADHSHCPLIDTMDVAAQTFANGDVENVDGSTGVQLHVDVGPLYGAGFVQAVAGAGGAVATYGDLGGGNTITEEGNEEIVFEPRGPYAETEGGKTILENLSYTRFGDLKAANFAERRLPVFYYSLWGHQTAFRAFDGTDDTSGLAERAASGLRRVADDHLITLGGSGWGVDANGFNVGSWQQQAGTFVHEFAHNLGLAHGGTDEANRKPNHRSVLNYLRVGGTQMQFCNVTTDAGGAATCDLSREELPALDEGSFDECLGYDSGGALGPVDADGDGILSGSSCGDGSSNIVVDLNIDKDTTDVLNGSDDWANLRLNHRDNPNTYGTSVVEGDPPVEAGPTAQQLQDAAEAFDAQSSPLIGVSAPPQVHVEEGQELVIAVELTNTGQGPAEHVDLELIAPDGSQLGDALPRLVRGATSGSTLRWTAPAGSAGTYQTEIVAAYAGLALLPKEASTSLEIVVTPHEAPNTIPAARDDTAVTAEDTPLDIAVLANDEDADGDPLTITVATDPVNGTAVVDGSTIVYTPAADFNGADGFTYTITDDEGASGTASVGITVTPVNDPPTASITTAQQAVSEGSDGELSGTVSDVDTGDPDADEVVTASWIAPAGCYVADPTALATTYRCVDDGPHQFTLTATDAAGAAGSDTVTVEVLNVAPSAAVTSPTESAMVPVGQTVHLDVAIVDPGTADIHTCAVAWSLGDTPVTGTVDQAADTCSASHTYLAPGVYDVTVTVVDDSSGVGTASLQVVIFEPGASVRGNGTLYSPAGAYAAAPDLEGEARFGFASRYQKGRTTPSGSTRFVFRTADLRFTSDAYEWLVVSGARAQFKGRGTLDVGTTSQAVGFLVTVIDGDRQGGGVTDGVRIKMWDLLSDEVIYDNRRGSGDETDDVTDVLSGRVVITRR